MPDINNIEEAVAAAIEEIPADQGVEEIVEEVENEESTEVEEEGQEEESTEVEEENAEETTKPNAFGLEDAQVAQAVEIYKALSGNKSAEAIKQLARQAGVKLAEDIEDTEEKTSPAPKKSSVDFEQILKSKLGARFEFLAGPIAEAFKELDQNQSSRVDAVKQDISANAFKKEVTEEITAYCKEHGLKDSIKDPVSGKIFELTKKYKFNGSTRNEFKEYFAEMHDLALAKLGKSRTQSRNNSEGKTDKINKNLASAEPEAAGSLGGKSRKTPPKEYTVEEAVAAAVRGENWGNED